MKIAVCLSGQPRTIEHTVESILKFFGNPEYTFDFFLHTWDYNVWKLKSTTGVELSSVERVDIRYLTEQLLRFFPKLYTIDSLDSNIVQEINRVHWGSLFYSMMKANHLRQKYEVENNIKYDYVVKSRFDVIFDPENTFRVLEPNRTMCAYFPHAARMKYRYNLINASDPSFYSDSYSMNIISDAYFYMKKDMESGIDIHRRDQHYYHDPGTYLSTVMKRLNIDIEIDGLIGDTIYRKEAIGLDSINNFKEINNLHGSFYI